MYKNTKFNHKFFIMRVLSLLCFLTVLPALAQNRLDLKKIMAGNEFIGHQPEKIVWAPDNKTVFFKWNHENNIIAPYYSASISNPEPKKIDSENQHLLPINGFHTNERNTIRFFQSGYDLYQWYKGEAALIYRSQSHYQVEKIIDDHSLILRVGKAYYLWNRTKNSFIEILSFKSEGEAEDEKELSYLEKQQTELFEYIKLGEQKEEAYAKHHKANQQKSVPNHFRDGYTLGQIAFNNQTSYAVYRLDRYPKSEPTEIQHFITSSGYLETKKARSKVGKEDPDHSLFIMDLKSGQSKKISIDNLPGIKKAPEYLALYDLNFNRDLTAPKSVIMTQIIFNNEGEKALIEIKSYDNKDRWVCILDMVSQSLKCIDHQHDEAWIGGPGISGWNMIPGNMGWIPNSNRFYFQSEETGYSHLYLYDLDTKVKQQLTDGQFEIHKASISKNGKTFYITANKTHPGNRGFYHLDIESKSWTPLFEKNGNYEVSISPDEKSLAIRYSSQNQPWELFLTDNKPNSKLTQVTHSTTAEFQTYQWRTPDLINLNAKQIDARPVYARIYRPKPELKNGAAIQFVHGAGYLQNAHFWWSTYYREYMFHNLLCDLGYTVIDIDYHASKGYGRDFRTSIYRHMGGADLDDQILGRNYLIKNEDINPEKIGIYGGSYGGFITIMALLTKPGQFKCGAAIRSVTDWAHYNHAYTSNILNTPQTDSIAFRQSSPIYFADQLEDELLILHGMVDDNVQFQDVVRLNQRFIELGKTNFTMALYPVEPHGFKQTSSWVDEYTRILNLFNHELLGKN